EPAPHGGPPRGTALPRGDPRGRPWPPGGHGPGPAPGHDVPGAERPPRLAARAAPAPEGGPPHVAPAGTPAGPDQDARPAPVCAGLAPAPPAAQASPEAAAGAGLHPFLPPGRQPALEPHVPAPRGVRAADGAPPPLLPSHHRGRGGGPAPPWQRRGG